ncbi:MAG TPA: hypothetical protein VHU84_16970 [Lacipirellulaceae bacterium]|jgi:hypothetical protein|nr:hypothetical protein [Lacipirellulaceae bacterium]
MKRQSTFPLTYVSHLLAESYRGSLKDLYPACFDSGGNLILRGISGILFGCTPHANGEWSSSPGLRPDLAAMHHEANSPTTNCQS